MLPLSIETKSGKSLKVRLEVYLQRRTFEFSLLIGALVIYAIAAFTHLSYHYRAVVTLASTTASLVAYFGFPNFGFLKLPRWTQVSLFSLVVSGLALTGVLVIREMFPSVAFKHVMRDSDTQVPVVPMTGEVDISVVIPARNEDDDLLLKTLQYLYTETPPVLLREVLIVDDASDEPTLPVIQRAAREGIFFPPEFQHKIRVIRIDQRQGLTNAKIIGAELAVGTHLFFLDGHCRVSAGYAERMLYRALNGDGNDIITPQVIDVEGSTFEFKSNSGGKKMMFEWNFEFGWFDTDPKDDRVPISSGGILLMSRVAFLNGKYDRGMLEWGGENIEQSLRAWMCGGKIFVEREAKIGHVFNRKLRPDRVKVSTVERNHARAAFVWLDDSIAFFEAKHKRGEMMLSQMGPYIDERLELRHRLKCGKFDDLFVDRFRTIFDQRNLFAQTERSIQDLQSGLCMSARQLSPEGRPRQRSVKLEWAVCQMHDTKQRFGAASNNTRVRQTYFERCIEVNPKTKIFSLIECDFGNGKVNQAWTLDTNSVHTNAGEPACILSPGTNITSAIASDIVAGPCTPDIVFRSLYIGV